MAKLKCNLCGFESNDAIEFAAHILSVHSEVGKTEAVEKPETKEMPEFLECVLCNAKFRTPEALEEHYKEAHPEEYQKALEELEQIQKEQSNYGVSGDRGGEEEAEKGNRKRTRKAKTASE